MKCFTTASVIATFGLAISMASAQANTPLTEAQIAHAAYTADVLDISYAQIALKKSKNTEVREFAKLMIRDHSAANKAALALVKKLGVTPEDNEFSKTLVKNGEKEKAVLQGLSGKKFDKAYAENELAYHKVVVATVANEWIPAIKNSEFKKFIVGANKIFTVHQGHAQHMVDELSK